MRKSFTRFSSVLVLLLLSVHLMFAAPGDPAWGDLTPDDGGTASSTTPTFTIDFGEPVSAVLGYTVGLYTDGLAAPMKVIQFTTATVGSAVIVNGDVVTFSFSGITLDENTTYDVLIEEEAFADANGSPFITTGDYTWEFSTPDLTAPKLATTGGLLPADDATGVLVDDNCVLTFTENVAFVAGYVQKLGDFAIYKSTSEYDGEEGGDLVSLAMPTLTWLAADQLEIDWVANLDPASDYYVRVKGGIIVDDGDLPYAGINNNIAWSFTTKASEDVDPTITVTAPHASGSLWTNDNFIVTFDEAMYIDKDVLLTTANIPDGLVALVDQDGVAVPCTSIVVTNNRVITMDPTALLSGTSYTVTVAADLLRDFDNNMNGDGEETFNAGDWNAPVIESLTTTNHGGTTFDILVETDEECVVHYIVVKETSPAATLFNVLGSNAAGATQNHATTPTLVYRAGDTYGIKTGTTWTYYDIFAEGDITVDPSLEVLERVSGLPDTNGESVLPVEGLYTVYAVAIDASADGVYDPNYSANSIAAINGNISGVSSVDAQTVDIIMPKVWFDADSATYSALLNKDEENGATAPEPLGEMARKAQIFLNFNESIKLADGGATIHNSDIESFVTVTDNGTAVGFEAEIDAAAKLITITPDSAFKSEADVVVSITPTMIEDVAGIEFQPSDADLSDQGFTVEEYSPVLALFTPAFGDSLVDVACITVKFDKVLYVPVDDEPTKGDMQLLNTDDVSNYWAGKYFEIREGDADGATIGDIPVKAEFNFDVSYTATETTVDICRNNDTEWQSETWYYIEAEGQLLDENRYSLADGYNIAHPAEGDFAAVTTDTLGGMAANGNNQSIRFKYEDTRAPEVIFYEESVYNAPSVVDIDGETTVLATETIGVLVDEYVNLGFADHIDFLAPGTGLTVDNNAMRRYFRILHGTDTLQFDVRNVNVVADSYLSLDLDPYYVTEDGYSEGPNFLAGEEYTVQFISTDLEGGEGSAYEDDNSNLVVRDEATFTIESTGTPDVLTADYTPADGAIVSASTSEIVINFSNSVDGTTIAAVPDITIEDATTNTVSALTGVLSNSYKTVTYAIAPALIETESYEVAVPADAFAFDGIAPTWPNPAGADSTWNFSTNDGTDPVVFDNGGGVLAFTPLDNAINISMSTDLVIRFSEDILPVTGKKLYLWESGVSEIFRIDASVCDHVGGDSIVVKNSNFASMLKYNTAYHVILAPGFVKDAAGNAFAGIADTSIWNFVTGPQPDVAFSAFGPKDDYLDVSTPLTITLNRAATAQVGKEFFVTNLTDGIVNAYNDNVTDLTTTDNITWTITGFTPVFGKQYTISLEDASFEAAGVYTPAMNAGSLGQATNVATPVWVINYNDVTAPTAKFWPVDAETSIPYNAYLYVKFSEHIALDDGTAISTDPTLIANNIASFVSLTYGSAVPVDSMLVEFVGASKQIIRITPLDVLGHNYTGDANATMQTEMLYNLTVVGSNGTYDLVDATGIAFVTDGVDFTTEDITAPDYTVAGASTPILFSETAVDSKSVTLEVESQLEGGHAYVYIMDGAPSTPPSAATIIENADWDGAVAAGVAKSTDKIVLDETVGTADYTAYVVVQDSAVDVYTNPIASEYWMFTETTDGVDRIRDILPAPNTSRVSSLAVTTCDDDAPTFETSTPIHNAHNVSVSDSIYLVFSEDVLYDGGVDSLITLRKASNNARVEAYVTAVNGDSILIAPGTFGSAADLEEETSYYVEIDRYALTDDAACGANDALIEWVGKENLYFTTVDITAPVIDSTLTERLATCVDPDALTQLSIYFTEANIASKNAGTNNSVRIYRTSTGTLLEVIPISSDRVSVDNDAEPQVMTVDVSTFQFLGDDTYTVEISAGSLIDDSGNLSADYSWTFSTLDNIAPAVTWEIHSLDYYFNNSYATEVGIDSKWSLSDDGGAGETSDAVSSHSILKVDFGENVVINTNPGSGTAMWLPLTKYDETQTASYSGSKTDSLLSRGEIFANLKVAGLDYHDTDTTLTDMLILNVNSQSITIGFKVEQAVLYDEATLGAGTVAYDYMGSLSLLDVDYAVTIDADAIADDPICSNERNLVVSDDVVIIDTRDDTPPTLEVSACESTCNTPTGEITLTFSKEVVKSSYDIVWVDHESHTADNLMLDASNIMDPNYFVLQVTGGDTLELKDIAVEVVDGKTVVSLTPKDSLVSRGDYTISFNKWTVKEFITNDPTGTLFEGESCEFHVADYEAPTIYSLSPNDDASNISSSPSSIVVTFNEKIMKGAGTVQIIRENSQIFEEVSIDDCTISSATSKNVLTIPFQEHTSLEDFEYFYVLMPEGFVTDTVVTCEAPNAFKGFTAALDANGIVIDAGWNFSTADKTAPELLTNVADELIGLWPAPLDENVSKNSDLILTFDENITITGTSNSGIVIYYDKGIDTDVDFGNAVEFIPWNSSLIEVSGSDIYNSLDANVITVDPATTFDRLGTYYIRVAGDNVEDWAFTPNKWSDSEVELVNEITKREWSFTITNDVAPVLVSTSPEYDGYAAPDDYYAFPAMDEGYVIADLSMTFEDGDGNALSVAKGDASRMVRIYETVYKPATLKWDDRLWLTIPITDPSITIEEGSNVVTINDVLLRDGINGDSAYNVQVDRGAILNGYEGSQTFWDGIPNGFRWRFQTASDDVFVADGPMIVSPVHESIDLTIEDASELVIEFGEGIEALVDPADSIRIWDMTAEPYVNVETVAVTSAMCADSTLTVPLAKLVDETKYYVEIEAGAFGDTSTVSTPNTAFGGDDVWVFTTGDNTAPAPVAFYPAVDTTCVAADVAITLTFDETINDDRLAIVEGEGTITITDGADFEQVLAIESIVGNVLTVETIEGLKDTTVYTVTVSEGLVLDGDVTPLQNEEFVWSFTTGENTKPTVVEITPELAVTADTVLSITFSEAVNAVSGIVMVNGEEVTVTSEDGLVYTAALTDLPSETTVDVVILAGAFEDVNDGCTANAIDSTVLAISVADIAAPMATYYESEYDDYVDVKLTIAFDDAVTAATGNVIIYDAETDLGVDTIAVGEFTPSTDSIYEVITNELYYGSFYVMIDAGSFVDDTAADIAKEFVQTTDWTFVISDEQFEECYTIISPVDGATQVATTTNLVIEFCDERIKAGVGNVYIADGSSDAGDIVIAVVDSLISDAMTLTIPVTGLAEMTSYTVTIDAGAVLDEAGNSFRGFVDGDIWNFTTIDETAPVVTLVADSVNNVDGVASMTRDEVGPVYLVLESVAADMAAITAAIEAGDAVAAMVTTADANVAVSTEGLTAGNYRAVAIDASGNVGESENVVVVEDIAEIPVYTIAEIQGEADASTLVDEIVKTSGVVTTVDNNGYYIQDASAAWSGIYVFDQDGAAVLNAGAAVEVVGTVSEYNGLTEINADEVTPIVMGLEITPVPISAADALSEMYEAVRVTVIGRAPATTSGSDDVVLTTESSVANTVSLYLYESGSYDWKENYNYSVTGIVYPSGDNFKVEPYFTSDIVNKSLADGIEDLSSLISVYPNPFNDYISITVSSEVELTRAVITNVAGQLVKEVINPNNKIATSELNNGVYFISLHTENGIAKTQRIIKK
ncbi:MAG: Ig-like domain-containing protein [Prolixibacteraceae bacterium]|jgi:methionine-rich copper-binding protein CopC|nr:Ig-like domain-containing protein [Prolixibacteraceae bacterium]